MAMLAAEDKLAPELLPVIAKHGDLACDFVWRNKGALTVSAGLAAFVASPEEFLDGTRGLAEIVGDAAVKPLAAVPGAVATEAAKGINWNLVLVVMAAGMGIVLHRRINYLRLAVRAAEWWISRRAARKEVRHG